MMTPRCVPVLVTIAVFHTDAGAQDIEIDELENYVGRFQTGLVLDLDGDGHLDLVINGRRIRWGMEDGNFTPEWQELEPSSGVKFPSSLPQRIRRPLITRSR